MTSRRFDDRQVLLLITIAVLMGVALATLTALLQFDSYAPICWIWGVFFAANMLELVYLRHLRAKYLGSGVCNARTG
jgi:hypothetical protein